MDRSWMYGKRTCTRFLQGVEEFSRVALDHRSHNQSKIILCPCCDCKNSRGYRDISDIKDHLIRRGFKDNYERWTWHGEILDIDASSSKCDSVEQQNSSDHENDNSDDNTVEVDRIDEMMRDVEDHLTDDPRVFDNVIRAAETPLYPGCTTFTKLGGTLKLFNLKASNCWTDRSFTQLLELLVEMLPEGNELPNSTYEAKKIMCPMGMEYEKIHACRNDCVLYRNENADMEECPRCGVSRYKRNSNGEARCRKGSPAKVLWYLPIIPRFIRLFSEENNAKMLRWHDEGRKKDGLLRHPADSPQWRNIDRKFKEFGEEVRNLRLGLCTDGMNPFGTLSTQYSTWPVLLTIYNLPPWLCMKARFLMMSLLISGPKQPGNDIDVYLAPLIEDLTLLWNEGVKVFDAYSKTSFTLRAMVFCTINDFPAYGNLSGYTVKGTNACPICEDDLEALRLEHCCKHVYMDNRRHLPVGHRFRRNKNAFNGKVEMREARAPLRAWEVYQRVNDIDNEFGKPPPKRKSTGGYKKQSVLWSLPYWRHLEVRHCLDVMHIEKNVCDAVVGTLLNMPGKTKDGVKVRMDMANMGREELAPESRGKRWYLPPACYTLSKKEKTSFCESLHSVKVPAGYSSNFRRIVSMSDLKLVGMKSHDCHVLMQQLLPVAIRGILPDQVRYTITRLCIFFNIVCSKVINLEILDEVQADIVETMCRFEMYFPPAFFDIMPHLVIHLVREIKICGPVWSRYMYPFERAMGDLKGKVMNPARPEASIVQRTVAEEVAAWAAQYLARAQNIGLPKSRHEGRLSGQGTIGRRMTTLGIEIMNKAEFFVLQSLVEVHPYLDEHMSYLKHKFPSKTDLQLMKEHNGSFVSWFKEQVMSQLSTAPLDISDTLRWLAYGPKTQVVLYEGYDINGYSFYTKRQDDKSTMQNSGVRVTGLTSEFVSSRDRTLVDRQKVYYGNIEEIIELDYVDFKIAMFRCKWADTNRGVKKDEHGYLTLVNFGRPGHVIDPFVLASQAKQVFYMADPIDCKWSIVLEGKRRILGIDDVVDEDEYDEQFNETPSSSWNIPTPVDDFAALKRVDHNEGIYVAKEKD